MVVDIVVKMVVVAIKEILLNTYTTDKSKYYTILGVNRGASQDEIKKAYHKLAKEHHPDKFVNSSDSEKKYHENKMKEINDAYENLTK